MDSYTNRKCANCGLEFKAKKKYINWNRKNEKNGAIFCSQQCFKDSIGASPPSILACANCGKAKKVKNSEFKKSSSGRVFCSRSCSATFNNTHKKKGSRRSKLEAWFEDQISKDYPSLDVIYNGKEAINSELDIYFPGLKLAVELNGIYHYEPIHGQEKLASIQNNDNRKFQACLEQGIELLIIDTSALNYFKPNRIWPYYNILKTILNTKRKTECNTKEQ